MIARLAIHNREGSFSDRWIQYCKDNGISYKIVNCFDSNILRQLEDIDALLWHWSHNEPNSLLVARHVIASIEKMNIRVFPDIKTCWHFDDKIAQKYLLESIRAPLVPTYIFYEKGKAMEWINRAKFPKVFKLRCGAGSQNVRLVKTRKEANKLCNIAFGKGFTAKSGYFGDYRTKIKKTKGLKQFLEKLRHMPKRIKNRSKLKRTLPKEQGYIYFQDFLADNSFDTRITVIGKSAFGFTRDTRTNDFRASGSGSIHYDLNRIDKRCVKIAFDTAERLKTQSLALDFCFDQSHKPNIIEISYCYQSKAVYDCRGHWDEKLIWQEGHIYPEDAILSDLIK